MKKETGTRNIQSAARPEKKVPSAPSISVGAVAAEPSLRAGIPPALPPLLSTAHGGIPCGITQSATLLGAAIDGGNNQSRPVLGGVGQDALSYAHRVAQQNQQDLSMLAYAYQQLNQQMNAPNKPFDQGRANPFL